MRRNTTFLAHSSAEALLETAVAALVALVFVDDAVPFKATRVDVVLAHGATEEALAAVARRCAIVSASRTVQTNGAERTRTACITDTDTDTAICR